MCASFCVPAPSEEVLLCHFGAAAGSSSAKVSTVHISRPAKQFEVQSASTPFGVYVKVCQQLLTPPPRAFSLAEDAWPGFGVGSTGCRPGVGICQALFHKPHVPGGTQD